MSGLKNGIIAETDEGKTYLPDFDAFIAALTEESKQEWRELRHAIYPYNRYKVTFTIEEWNPPMAR